MLKTRYNCTTMMQVTTAPRAPKEIKKDGFIPAVYYGAHVSSTPIFINQAEFTKIIATEGNSAMLTIATENGKESVMVKDVQYHPVKGYVVHADFYVLEKGKKVHVKLPIIFTGESKAVKDGGVLVKVMHEISVEGDPSKMPHEISVSIAPLVTAESVVTIKDIVLPEGVVAYHTNPLEVVASIAVSTELGEMTQVDLSTIEVAKKGKKESDAETNGSDAK